MGGLEEGLFGRQTTLEYYAVVTGTRTTQTNSLTQGLELGRKRI